MDIPIECFSGEVLGCTYSNALNYNPSATVDDGSCVFTTVTGNSFEVNVFATHYTDCGVDGSRTAGFYLHIPEIFATNPV